MIITMFIGYLLGLTIPSVASRFGKILPADPGLICALLWHRPRFPKPRSAYRLKQLSQKWQKLIWCSIMWAIVMSGLYCLTYLYVAPEMLVFGCAFLYMVGLLMAIDHQFYLLPDFLTIPLLLLGVTAAVVSPIEQLSLIDRLVGAWFGYLLSTVSVFIMYFFKKGEFGAGDVKMLTALGAWLGAICLNCVLVLSFIFFYICAICKNKRADAFGPALGAAAIIIFFAVYTNLLWTIL